MNRLRELKKKFRPGRPYRRSEVAGWTTSVDRDLKTLVEEGYLEKPRTGIYYRPKNSAFGAVPPDDRSLVRTFLKDDHFLLTSPNAYNALGLTTQLYNKTVVYNHKRHGDFTLGGRRFSFRFRPRFPQGRPAPEFLLVDLVNNVDSLAEDRETLLRRVEERALRMDRKRLQKAVGEYGFESTKRFFSKVLEGQASAA